MKKNCIICAAPVPPDPATGRPQNARKTCSKKCAAVQTSRRRRSRREAKKAVAEAFGDGT